MTLFENICHSLSYHEGINKIWWKKENMVIQVFFPVLHHAIVTPSLSLSKRKQITLWKNSEQTHFNMIDKVPRLRYWVIGMGWGVIALKLVSQRSARILKRYIKIYFLPFYIRQTFSKLDWVKCLLSGTV